MKKAKATSVVLECQASLVAALAALREKSKARREAMKPVLAQWLAEQREQLKQRFFATGDAPVMLETHTQVVDTLISVLYAEATDGKNPPVALVATGGYGRGDLYPYSDIDLLFLYEKKQAKEAARIAEFILYLLWDLGFAVGQAHRNIDEAIEAAADITVRTSLLDARRVTGSQAVFDTFRKRFDEEVVSGSVTAFIDAKLAERDERHRRYGDSRYMLEPNVKEGKGGLRDLHTLWWLARTVYPITTLEDLVAMKHLTREEYAACDQARQFLRKVRVHLHYIAGRAEERLSFDVQLQLAQAMGFSHPNPNYAITRFMRRYFIAVRMVGNVTRIFCALLEDEKKRTPRHVFTWLWQNPWTLGGFKLEGERLTVRHANMFAKRPVAMLELFAVAQQHGLDIHPRAIQLIARSLKRIDHTLQHDPEANRIFLDILLSDKGPETTLRRMSEAGVLGRFIPDFNRVIGMTQFNMYHVFTVDEHTLVALGIMHAIEKGQLKDQLPLASDVIHRVRMKRVLYVALFCHDIAKGRGGDHSQLGETIVRRLSVRFGFSDDETDTAAWLVRHHLLFSHTAFKRDINDPKTISDFVAQVKNSEQLKLLVVLTVADMRAVAPGVWNTWRGALMRDLYRRADEAMGTGTAELQHHQSAQFRQDLVRQLSGWDEHEVDYYLAQGNAAIWTACDVPHHGVIARMLKEAENMPLPLLVHTQHDYEHAVTEVTLLASDQHGLFSKVAGAMSLAGANILGAKIFTLKNGIAVEIFQVTDKAAGVFDHPEKLARMSVNIEQALFGDLDLTEALYVRQRQYRRQRDDIHRVAAQVLIDNEASNMHTVIEISGRDRTGFLYQVTKSIADLGLSIATAHISTYGVQASDVFYVKDLFGMKITHEGKLKIIRETLLEVVGGGGV